jgi:hypothetical protein
MIYEVSKIQHNTGVRCNMVISKYFRHHIVGSIMLFMKFTLSNKFVIFEKMIFKSKSLFFLNNHFIKNM